MLNTVAEQRGYQVYLFALQAAAVGQRVTVEVTESWLELMEDRQLEAVEVLEAVGQASSWARDCRLVYQYWLQRLDCSIALCELMAASLELKAKILRGSQHV